MAERLASILEGFRGALRREGLPPPPAGAPRAEGHPGLVGLILGRETLPLDPPAAVPLQRGNLALLFAIERLDQGPPLPAHRRSPWLAWFIRPERLDD